MPWVEAQAPFASEATGEERATGAPAVAKNIADVGPPQAKPLSVSTAGTSGVSAPARFGQTLTIGKGLKRIHSFSNALQKTYGDVASAYGKVRGNHYRELTAVNIAAAKKIKPPSLVRYSTFIGLSLLVDISISPVITALWASVILGVLATLVLGVFMALAGRILLGSDGKKAAKSRKELQQKASDIERDLKVVQQEYQNFLRWIQAAAAQFPRVAARATTAAARVGRIAGKYKVVRYAMKLVNWMKQGWAKQTAEAVPLVNILPWWTIGAVATYLSHRGDYREAQDLLLHYNQGKVEVLGKTDAIYQGRLGVIEDMHTELSTQTNDSFAPEIVPAT